MKKPFARGRRAAAGFTLVQVMISAAVIVIAGVSSISGLLTVNREAATMRLYSEARAIVQRCTDKALTVPFTSTSTPTILATTGSSGSSFDENGDGNYNENVAYLRSGNTLVTGTVTRTVVAEANPDSAVIYRVTFQINYNFRGRAYSYQMVSLRAQD